MENDPDQTIKPIGHTKLCEKCNVNVVPIAWDAHLKSEKDLSGEPDKSRKVCKKCNIEVRRGSWKRHLRVKKHLKLRS